MKRERLVHELTVMPNAALVHRNGLCNLIIKDLDNLPILLELTFQVDDKLSIRAAWILELVCKESLNYIIPHLDFFLNRIKTVKFDSAKRPCAKICELIALDYDKGSTIKPFLTTQHKDALTACCFDWMIGNEKVAVDAYAMTCLYIFGKESDWIHQELRDILEENMAKKSCGYKARGLKILKLMS